MELLVIVDIVARSLHIILGVIWVGFGVLAAWVLAPLARQYGEAGRVVLRGFFAHSRFNQIMPVAAIGTTVAGLYLWARRANGMDLQGFSDTGDIVMAVGALFGLLAFGHGIGIGRMSGKYAVLSREVNDGQRAADDEEYTSMEARYGRNANISAILSAIALIAMSAARYL